MSPTATNEIRSLAAFCDGFLRAHLAHANNSTGGRRATSRAEFVKDKRRAAQHATLQGPAWLSLQSTAACHNQGLMMPLGHAASPPLTFGGTKTSSPLATSTFAPGDSRPLDAGCAWRRTSIAAVVETLRDAALTIPTAHGSALYVDSRVLELHRLSWVTPRTDGGKDTMTSAINMTQQKNSTQAARQTPENRASHWDEHLCYPAPSRGSFRGGGQPRTVGNDESAPSGVVAVSRKLGLIRLQVRSTDAYFHASQLC
jgi:hypothetical protein